MQPELFLDERWSLISGISKEFDVISQLKFKAESHLYPDS